MTHRFKSSPQEDEADSSDKTLLRKFPLFFDLSPEALAVTEQHMYETHYDAGERIFEEGEKGGYVCFVIDGVLEVLKKNSDGQEICVAEIHAGQSVGEMSLVDDTQRAAAARSISQSRAVILTKKGFNLLERQHPEIAIVLYKHFTKMLSATVRENSQELADTLTVSAEHTIIQRPS